MKQSEIFALDHFLECYPKNKTVHEILDLLKDEEDIQVIVRELYINITDDDYLTLLILEMISKIEKQFFPIHELVTVIDRDTVKRLFFTLVGRPPFTDELNKLCNSLEDTLAFEFHHKFTDALMLLNIKTNSKKDN